MTNIPSDNLPPPAKNIRRRARKRPAADTARDAAPLERPVKKRWWTNILARAWRPKTRGTLDFERQLIFSLREAKWPTLRQLRHATRVFSTTERRLLLSCVVMILAATTWLGVNEARARLVSVPVNGGTYTEAIVGQPRFLNPLFASGSPVDSDLTRLVYSGLLRYENDLSLVPDLAESFTTTDGKTYTVTLRPNLTWHDGEPLTIDDVLFTFQSATTTELDSPLAPNFAGIVVEKIDDRTVRFTLRDAYAAFPHLLTTGILPKHVWSPIPVKEWRSTELNLRPVGSGPWQFDNLSREHDGLVKQYSLVRAPERAGVTSPYLDQIVFKFFPDETSAKEALNARAVQGLALLGRGEGRTTLSRHLITHNITLPAVTAVFFNLNVASPVQNTKVRQALRAAIDTQKLIAETLAGNAMAIHGPLPVGTVTPPANTSPAADPAALLVEAGWTRVGALWQDKDGNTLSLNLSVVDREPDRSVGTAIVSAWQTLGIDTRIDLISPADAAHVQSSLLRPRSYQALLFTLGYGATPDPYPFWHSSQRVDPGLNLSLFSNKDVDDAIEQARRTLDPAVRARAFERLEQIILQEVPAIFLYAPIRHYVISDDIHGVTLGAIAVPADRFNALARWYTKAREALR